MWLEEFHAISRHNFVIFIWVHPFDHIPKLCTVKHRTHLYCVPAFVFFNFFPFQFTLYLYCSEWTLKSCRYIIKDITPGNIQKNFGILRINTCCKNRKKCAWEINSGVIKMYGTCRGKWCVKKGNKKIKNKRIRLLQEVCAFYKRYFSLRVNNQDFMEPEHTKSKWSVIEPLAVTVPKTSGHYRVDIPGKRDQQEKRDSSLVTTSRDSINGKKSDVPLHVRNWWKRFRTPKNPSSWEEGEKI